MAWNQRIQEQRILREAEGYLELGLFQRALDALARWNQDSLRDGRVSYLRGEALRSLKRYREALYHLQFAAESVPENVHIFLALGWCHKRMGRLDLAIESLEQALELDSDEAIIHYNLACYWSLAGNKLYALRYLTQTLELDDRYRDFVDGEPDFDAVRDDPDFRTLTSATT